MARGIHKYTVQEAENASLGQAGYKYCATAGTTNTGTAAEGTEYVAITSLNDATNVATTSFDTNLFPNLNCVVPAGVTIYGRWSKVTISAVGGAALIYKG